MRNSSLMACRAALLSVLVVALQAASPENDDFYRAATLNGMVIDGNTAEATRQPGEPYNTNGVRSVWYKWTPMNSSPPDTADRYQLVVEEGNVSAWWFKPSGESLFDLSRIGRDGDQLQLVNGRTYIIAVYSPMEMGGAFRLKIEPIRVAHPPANDHFRDSLALNWTRNNSVCVGTTAFATVEPGEPGSISEASVWYNFVPAFSGSLQAELRQGRADLAVYQGNSLQELSPAGQFLTGGTRYRLRATRAAADPGDFWFALSYVPSPLEKPANDNFVDAAVLPTGTNILEGDLRATAEPGEPPMLGNGAIPAENTRWWKYQAQQNGHMLTFTRLGDGSVGQYAIYSGEAQMNQITRLPLSSNTSDVQYIPLESGTTYYIQSRAPSLTVRIHEGGLINDSFAQAYAITNYSESPLQDFSVELTAHNVGATSEAGEPRIEGGIGHSIWYKWQAPYDGWAAFWAGQGPYKVAVYSGSSLGTLTPVSPSGFPVVKGDVFYLQIDSLESGGSFFVRLGSSSGYTDNDMFAQARLLPDDADYSTVSLASVEPLEPAHLPGPHKSVWWKWVPRFSGLLNLLGRSTTENATVAMYAGESLDGLKLVGKGESSIWVRVRGGESYRIAIAVPTNASQQASIHPIFWPEWETNEISGNLLQNGSFEHGLTNWSMGETPSSALSDVAPHKYNYLRMPIAPASLSQSVAVQPGVPHVLRFAFATHGRANPGGAKIRVLIGRDVAGIVESAAPGQWNWTNFNIIPQDSPITLKFENLQDSSWIDGVSLAALNQPPQILEDLSDIQALPGDHVFLKVRAAGSEALSYRWYKDGNLIAGENNPHLRLRAVSVLQSAGAYQVVITNAFGRAASRRMSLDVVEFSNPSILVQPASGTGFLSNYFALSVTAAGPSPLRYQWMKNGLAISGATGPDLVFENLSAQDAGQYAVKVMAGDQTVLSQNATVSVVPNLTDPSGGMWIVQATYGRVFDFDGRVALDGPAYVGQVFFGTEPKNLRSHWAPAAVDPSFGLQEPPATRDLLVPSLPANGNGFVQLRVWERAKGATFEHAKKAGGHIAESAVTPLEFAPWGIVFSIPQIDLQPGSRSFSLSASDGFQSIEFPALPNVRFGSAAIPLRATASSGLLVRFEVAFGPGTIAGTNFHATGLGVVGIRAIQDGNGAYRAAQFLQTLEVSRGIEPIDFTVRREGGDSVALVAATPASLPVRFEIVEGAATIERTLVRDIGDQGVVIRASHDGSELYEPGSVDRKILANLLEQTIDFPPIPDLIQEPAVAALSLAQAAPTRFPEVQLNATASSGLPVNFVLLSGPAFLTNQRITITNDGQIVVRAVQAGDFIFKPAQADRSFVADLPNPQKVVQAINFEPVLGLTVGSPAVLLVASADSGLPVTFELLSGPAQLAGNALLATGAGPILIRASQAGNDIYASASVEQTIVVKKQPQSIIFSPVPALTLGTAFSLEAAASSGLSVIFQVISGPGQIDGSSLLPFAPGTIAVRAHQAGNEIFESASVEQTIAVQKKTQTIDFSDPGPLRIDTTVALRASASSGQTVVFELVSGAARLTGNLLTPTNRGAIVVRASQSGNGTYQPASAERTFQPEKENQRIDFTPISSIRFGSSAALHATASSGLPVDFEILSGPARIDGNTLTATNVGKIEILATQAGSDVFEAASSAPQIVTVEKALQTISFAFPATVLISELPKTLNATASSGLPVTFAAVSGPGRVEGNILFSSAAGIAAISASQAGNELYEPASPIEHSVEILPLPEIQIRAFGAAFSILWSQRYPGFILESASRLEGPWTPSNGAPEIMGSMLGQMVGTPIGNVFYRLRLN